jgi:hypothetical protein
VTSNRKSSVETRRPQLGGFVQDELKLAGQVVWHLEADCACRLEQGSPNSRALDATGDASEVQLASWNSLLGNRSEASL